MICPVRHVQSLSYCSTTLIHYALKGLSQSPKTLPCKYFYDARGSELFEEITRLPEYYPTRTELGIMRTHVDEMAAELVPEVRLVEFGCGSGEKTASLVGAMERPASCVLVDISETALKESMERLAERFAEIELVGVCADYTSALELPAPAPLTPIGSVTCVAPSISKLTPSAPLDPMLDTIRLPAASWVAVAWPVVWPGSPS